MNNLSRVGEITKAKERGEKENGYARVGGARSLLILRSARARLIIDREKFSPRARPIINYN